jgi:hypothetical protein
VDSEQSEAEIGWNTARASRRKWSIILATVVCAIFIAVFVLVAFGHPKSVSIDHDGFVSKRQIPYGFEFVLPAPSAHISWTDITILLSNGADTVSWANLTTKDLGTRVTNATWHYGHAQSLGTLSVWLNVTDLTGNGRLDNGDFLSITTGSSAVFSTNSTYTLVLLYEPTDESILSHDFTGVKSIQSS